MDKRVRARTRFCAGWASREQTERQQHEERDSNANQLCASFAQAAPNQRTKQKQNAYHLPQCRMVSYAQLRKVGPYESRESTLCSTDGFGMSAHEDHDVIRLEINEWILRVDNSP
jgi:hypothetical protein